jgi:hypothetical protein
MKAFLLLPGAKSSGSQQIDSGNIRWATAVPLIEARPPEVKSNTQRPAASSRNAPAARTGTKSTNAPHSTELPGAVGNPQKSSELLVAVCDMKNPAFRRDFRLQVIDFVW